MNKTTQLVLAAIAGFGLCAQARTSTNELWDVDFAGVNIPEAGSVQLSSVPSSAFADGAWTVQEDDESYVTNGVGRSGSLSNLLELNTQGNDLTWTPTSTGDVGNRSIVETDIFFVGADDAPEGFDAGTAQTAFYLQNLYGEEPDEPTGYQLYAWAWDTTPGANSNHWEAIGSPFGSTFADSWHKIQIVIDYRDADPYLHVAVDDTEVTGDGVVAANKTGTKTTGKVMAVSFKGTGAIDNFAGTRLNTYYESYDFTAQVYLDGDPDSTIAGASELEDVGVGVADADFPDFKARFADLPIDDAGISDPTYSLSSVVIVDLATGAETTYEYTYDKVNYDIVPVSTACPYLAVDSGLATLAVPTFGATSNSLIAKVYYRTLDAYYANEVITVGETTVTNPTFVKPADCPKDFTNVYPAATNVNETSYVLSTVQVRGGAIVDFANDQATVSFSVADKLAADTTYVEATYVAGTYNADAVDWTFDSTTGIGSFTAKTFTVAFTWHGGSSSATYTYGDSLAAPTVDATYTEGGATYTFTGWSPAVPATVTAADTYVAQYEMTSAPKATVLIITDNGATTNKFGTYGSLADAVEAAPAGATVVLNDDDAADRVTVEDDLTIDLGGHTFTGRLSMFDGNVVVTNGTVAGRFDAYDSSVVTIAAGATVDGYVVVWGDGTYGEADCKTPTLTVDGAINTTGETFGIMVGDTDTSRPSIAIRDGARIQAENGGVALYNGASLTMTGGSIESPSVGVGVHGGSTFTMTGGSITTGEFGVYNNGMETVATTIAVSGGTITSTNEVNTACGIYQAGIGSLTLSGTAVVSGPDAVEVRAGTVQVLDNARLVATMPYTEPASNGNGNSGHGGVALLVSQHTTAQNVSASVDGGTLQGEVAFQEATVETQNDETKVSGAINAGAILGEVKSEDIADVIPSTSTALFADADAEGVEEGYRLVEDPENPGLYKVEPIVMHLLETAIALRYNCYTNVTVVDYPEGATFGWTISTNGVVFKPTQGPVPISSGKTTASVKVYAGATPFETATATVAVTNNGVQIGTLSATIALDDVAAVVDGVTYAKANLDAAAAAAIANNKVLGLYVNGPTITLAEGQTLVSQVLSERNNPTPSVKAPAGTAEKVYTVNTAIDNATKTRTYTLTYDTPTVMYTSTDGQTVEYLDAKFKISKNGTYKLLKDVTRDQLSVGNYTAVLDLDGHEFSSTVTGSKGAIYVDSLIGNASLTIRDTAGGGSIVAENCYAIWGNRNATIAIEGGEIVGKADVVYLSNAADTLTITGGTFRMASGSANFMLNMLDSARGSITVTGGSFYGFDPMNNTAEGANTDFVALTHASVADSPSAGWYTVVPAYTVTWNDEDGTALETDTRVATGATPSFDGETPAKASTAQYDYAFDAWTPATEAVASNTVYTATYTETLRTYTITWVNYDGTTVLDTDVVAYGETPEYTGETPTKPNDGDTEYEFDAWSPAIVAVTGEATYTATFKEKENGTVIVITDNGATTNYFATLPLAFAAAVDGDTVALLANQNLDERVFVNAGATPVYAGTNNRYATTSDNRSLTLDLNGHSITNSSNIALAGGSLNITGSGEIATTASGLAPVEVRGTGDLASKRTLTVGPDVTLAGGEYGLNVFGSNDAQKNVIDVTVNGSVKGTLFVLGNLKNAENEINIVVNGSVIAPAGVGDDVVVGIALNGNANVTVNDGAVVSGDSGIEVRAGNLTVNGGTITATADSYSYKANGSGSTTKGAAISVAQHTTALSMTATLNGGTLVGVEEVYVKDVNNNNLSNVGVVATASFAEDATVPEGFAWIDNGEGDYVLTKVWVVTYANYDDTVLQVTTNVTGVATPAYAGEEPSRADDESYTYEFAGWTPTPDLTVTSNATYTATYTATAISGGDDHIGAKSKEGFVILAPTDGDYDSAKPLTFAAPDLTAGKVAISASMIAPDSGTTATLTLLYKTSLTDADYTTAQVTVKDIDATAGTATVELPPNLGDTVFFFGFRNEDGVVDKTPEP